MITRSIRQKALTGLLLPAAHWRITWDSEIVAISLARPGAYQVRVKGSAVSFVGAAASVLIATGDAPAYTHNITAPVFDSVYTGYTQPEAKAVIISSAGNSDTAISSVALTGDAGAFALNKTDGATIAAGATDETTYTIRPSACLCDVHSPEGRHPLGHCPALWLHCGGNC